MRSCATGSDATAVGFVVDFVDSVAVVVAVDGADARRTGKSFQQMSEIDHCTSVASYSPQMTCYRYC